MNQVENDLDSTQEKLMNANGSLEEKEKALQNVSFLHKFTNFFFSFFLFLRSVLPQFYSELAIWREKKKAKEEVEALEKKMQQLENELSQTQTNLETATQNLEEKEKALQNVSFGRACAAPRFEFLCIALISVLTYIHESENESFLNMYQGINYHDNYFPVYLCLSNIFWPRARSSGPINYFDGSLAASI